GSTRTARTWGRCGSTARPRGFPCGRCTRLRCSSRSACGRRTPSCGCDAQWKPRWSWRPARWSCTRRSAGNAATAPLSVICWPNWSRKAEWPSRWRTCSKCVRPAVVATCGCRRSARPSIRPTSATRITRSTCRTRPPPVWTRWRSPIAWGTDCRTSTWPTARVHPGTNIWSPAGAINRVPNCWSGWWNGITGAAWCWRSTRGRPSTPRVGWPISPRRGCSLGCISVSDRRAAATVGKNVIIGRVGTTFRFRTRRVCVVEPLRSLILAAADNDVIRRVVATAPGSRQIVARFVAGESVADALEVVHTITADGRRATLDYLGEYTSDPELAERTVRTYLRLLDELAERRLAESVEVSVKLSALTVDGDEVLASRNLGLNCEAAADCGTTVTVDMEDHTTTDATLRAVRKARRTWPWVGAVVQSYLRRTESDVATLAYEGSRVRLCKGAYAEPAEVAFTDAHAVDLSYVRCANSLLAGGAYAMFATHDPRLVNVLRQRTRWYGRRQGSYEYQMLYGIRPDEQRRLAAEGETVRVYVPFGEHWYGYLMRRLAERPANLALFLRALVSRS